MNESLPIEMTRFCVKCRSRIDDKRTTRGSYFCSDDCRKLDKKARRQHKASRDCRLCGRRARRVRPDESAQTRQIASRLCAPGAQRDLKAGQNRKTGKNE